MKTLLLLGGALACALAGRAQTVPFNASAPMRGGAYNQTAVPATNPALNQSTIQGPTQVQRTTSSYDAQPGRLPVGAGVPATGTPETSPNSVPDPREQPLIMQRRARQSSDVVPTRGTGSSTIQQNRPPQPTNSSVIVAPQP